MATPAIGQDAKASIPHGRKSVTIPLETNGGYIVLPISINGSRPLSILLDTGMPSAGIALFDGPHVDRLKLEYLSTRAHVGGAGGSKRYEARISTGATFELGGARITGSQLIVMPPIPHFDIGYAGIIGHELLSAFAVSVDYDSQQVVLTQPNAFEPPKHSTAVQLDMIDNKPHIEARLTASGTGSERVHLLLDLGASHTVSLNVANAATSVPAPAVERQIGRGLSGAIHGHVARIRAFELGGHRFESVVAQFREALPGDSASGGRDGNLGIDLMSRFNFTLDYTKQALYLAPNTRFGAAFEADMTGLTLESADGEELRVAEVVPGFPAAEAGVLKGDTILAVDGEELSGRDRLGLGGRFQSEGAIVLTVRSGNDTPRDVELTLRRRI